MLNRPLLTLLLLNFTGLGLSFLAATSGVLGGFEEVLFTGMAAMALLTLTLGVTFLFIGRLKTLGAVVGLFALVPLCILEMFCYAWNAPFGGEYAQEVNAQITKTQVAEVAPGEDPASKLAWILSNPDGRFHCSREAIPYSLRSRLGWDSLEVSIAEPDSPFRTGRIAYGDSLPSRQLIFCLDSRSHWLVFYSQGGIGMHQAVKVVDLSGRRQSKLIEGTLLTDCLDPLCLAEAVRAGELTLQ